MINSITHKTRTFGQSHWINGAALVRDIVETIEPCVQRDTFDILSNTKRCKQLARAIKSRRAPSWPLQDLSDLPSKAVADDLIDCYLQTIESVYRILHVPSFRRDYEALWTSTAEPNPAFLIQLKLVLAIGATMHDNRFSLRTSAIRWVYEAQTWVSEPRFKSMLGIQYVQVYLLLLLARETADVACELIWISVGTLYRVAIQMGLHRDPSLLPHGTTLMAEMRRRLWNTILEISLQSSLTAGGPPLTSLEDFDTQSPGNFDDEQIMTESPVAKSEDEHTQLSVAIALRKTLPYRLAVTKALNNLGARNTYETTLRLDAELRESYKALRQTLHRCVSNSSPSTSRYAIRMADIIMHRYLSALHIPFFGPAFNETAFAFSRKVVVESSLKIWYAIFPSSYNLNAASGSDDMISSNEDWLARLMICGSGFFRVVAFQATFSLVIELRSQLQEEEGLGPVSARPDLLAVLEGAKSWAFACVEAGETSVKGYLFLCVISAQVRGLLRGIGEDKEPELLAKAAAEAVTRCLPVLEAAADQLQPSETSAERDSGSINQPLGTTDSWDFMVSSDAIVVLILSADCCYQMSDSMLDAGNFDPTSWSFGDDMFQEPSFW